MSIRKSITAQIKALCLRPKSLKQSWCIRLNFESFQWHFFLPESVWWCLNMKLAGTLEEELHSSYLVKSNVCGMYMHPKNTYIYSCACVYTGIYAYLCNPLFSASGECLLRTELAPVAHTMARHRGDHSEVNMIQQDLKVVFATLLTSVEPTHKQKCSHMLECCCWIRMSWNSHIKLDHT